MLTEDEIVEKIINQIANQCQFNVELGEFGYVYGSTKGTETDLLIEIQQDKFDINFQTDTPNKLLDFVLHELDIVYFPLDRVSECGTVIDLQLKTHKSCQIGNTVYFEFEVSKV